MKLNFIKKRTRESQLLQLLQLLKGLINPNWINKRLKENQKPFTRKKALLSWIIFSFLFLVFAGIAAPKDTTKTQELLANAPKATEEPKATATPTPTIDPAVKKVADDQAKADADAKAKLDADAKTKKDAADKQKADDDAKAKANADGEKAALIFKTITPNLAADRKMDDLTYAFIVDNNKWFPAKTDGDKQAARDKVDPAITTRNLFKNVMPYFEKMVKVTGSVVQVHEENTDYGTIATVHILDDFGNSVMGVYLGSTGDLLDRDRATIIGVPITPYSFSNVSGGTTNAILMALSEVKKVLQ